MKRNYASFVVAGLSSLLVVAALAGCTGMTTLPDSKLQETASAVVGKPMKSVSEVRYVDDRAFYNANATDGTVYACQLSVLFGMTSQHQQCDKK